MKNLIAQGINIGPLRGKGPLGLEGAGDAGGAGGLFTKALSTIIGVMTVVAFIWFTFMVLIGAIRIIVSGGDKAQLEAARKQITTGIIGVIVVIAAIFIAQLVGTLLGVPDILNPTKLLGI